jgi:UDP-N-acetylmuramyl tripeptide synthase
MSMADDLNELKRYASMKDAITDVARARIAGETVLSGADITLGEDHLGMVAIHEAHNQMIAKAEEFTEAIRHFEDTVKGVANAILRSLGEDPS